MKPDKKCSFYFPASSLALPLQGDHRRTTPSDETHYNVLLQFGHIHNFNSTGKWSES